MPAPQVAFEPKLTPMGLGPPKGIWVVPCALGVEVDGALNNGVEVDPCSLGSGA